MWFSDTANHLLYEEYFHLTNTDRIIRTGLICLLLPAIYDILDGNFDITTADFRFLFELMISLDLFLLFIKSILKP